MMAPLTSSPVWPARGPARRPSRGPRYRDGLLVNVPLNVAPASPPFFQTMLIVDPPPLQLPLLFPILRAVEMGQGLRGRHVVERFVVFDRDEASPDDPEEAWNGQRRSVWRFRLPHLVRPAGLEQVLDVALSPTHGTPPGTSRAEQEELFV